MTRVGVEGVRAAAQPLEGGGGDYDALLWLVGDARVVLLGEATHGTREFYRERSRITRLLIEDAGFRVVAVEADWPDAYRVNRYVRGLSDDADAATSLADFTRFPLWMWRNREVVELVEWLRSYNASLAGGRSKAGFYGLDLYSLYTSIEAVLRYLETVDPGGRRCRTATRRRCTKWRWGTSTCRCAGARARVRWRLAGWSGRSA